MKWKHNRKLACYDSGTYSVYKNDEGSWSAYSGFRLIGKFPTMRRAKAECLYHKDPNPATAINAVCS